MNQNEINNFVQRVLLHVTTWTRNGMVGEKFSEVFRIKTLTLKHPLEFAHNFQIEMSENSGCFKS